MKKADSESASADATLLSIGDVATATGISTETLRMWERRYGRPEAVRLPSGHRRYTDAQVIWLRRVAEALARGYRPHKVVRMPDDELEALLGDGPTGPETDGAVARRLRWVRTHEGSRLVADLELAWHPEDPVAFLDDVVAPLLTAVGRGWADGQLDIRHEHFVSEVLVDFLRGLRARYPTTPAEPRVLLTTLAGEQHALGIQMAALLCAARGVPARILGVNTPSEEIVRDVAESGVTLVGLSVSLATAGVETDRALAELRALLPDGVRLVVGGEGARGVRRGPRGVEYARTLAAWDALVSDLA